MIRRYIAATLIVFFFSYAAYLIITDGGKANTTISFAKLNKNIQNKFMILTGKIEAKPTPDELARIKELEEMKAAKEAADETAKIKTAADAKAASEDAESGNSKPNS